MNPFCLCRRAHFASGAGSKVETFRVFFPLASWWSEATCGGRCLFFKSNNLIRPTYDLGQPDNLHSGSIYIVLTLQAELKN